MDLRELDHIDDEFLPHQTVRKTSRVEDVNGDEDENITENVVDIDERIREFRSTFCEEIDENDNSDEGDDDRDDIVCNGRFDRGDFEEKVKKACTCKKDNCLKDLSLDEIQNVILSTNELTRDERDMYIMGKLNCVGHGDKTQRGKERKRKRYAYYHQGHEICKSAFMLLHDVSNKYVKNIVAHMNENGNVPRVHKNKNKRPANAFSFDELKHALNYIMHYAEEVGLPQPMVRGKGNPVVFLPSSGSKSDLHKQYVASCEEARIRHLGLTSFKLLWKDCCPHIKFMSPMSDMCPKCEEHRDAISKAVGMEQKQEAVRLFSEHLTIVQKEREVYNKSVDDARVEMTDYVRPAGVIPPCSANLTKVHYTMDFSQAVSVPHHARQEGPLYFLVPRKLQLFGIAVEGIFRQFNYVIDEDQTVGENGTGIKGPNGVISMLHHCLQQNGFGEEECIIHCDNCAGENKNRYVLGYLSWRTLIGLHKKITLSMQVPYHGRCLVDAGFGHIKRLYRRTDVDSLSSMINVVDKSAKSNVPVGYENPRNGEHNWEWYDWKTYLSTHFSPLPGIRKYRHFTFDVQSPGSVQVKESCDGVPKSVKLLKSEATALTDPPMPTIRYHKGEGDISVQYDPAIRSGSIQGCHVSQSRRVI